MCVNAKQIVDDFGLLDSFLFDVTVNTFRMTKYGYLYKLCT